MPGGGAGGAAGAPAGGLGGPGGGGAPAQAGPGRCSQELSIHCLNRQRSRVRQR